MNKEYKGIPYPPLLLKKNLSRIFWVMFIASIILILPTFFITRKDYLMLTMFLIFFMGSIYFLLVALFWKSAADFQSALLKISEDGILHYKRGALKKNWVWEQIKEVKVLKDGQNNVELISLKGREGQFMISGFERMDEILTDLKMFVGSRALFVET